MAGRTPAEIEALKTSAAQCGHTFAKVESALPGFLSRLAQRELNKAYSKSAPAWLPLTRRTDTYFGRKRRARRARGRQIASRQPYSSAALAMAALFRYEKKRRPSSYSAAIYIVPTEQDARAFFDPSMGEPWQGDSDA